MIKLIKKFKRQMAYIQYRMKIRQALNTCDLEQLKIVKDEAIDEINRRKKQK